MSSLLSDLKRFWTSGLRRSQQESVSRKSAVRFRPLRVEPMEERTLLSATTIIYSHTVLEILSDGVTPATTSYTPAQIRTAYGLTSISGDGDGQTIAIVDAYRDPNVVAELTYFTNYYGLGTLGTDFTLTVINQTGGSDVSGISYDSGWAHEIALDVQWAHAIAPKADIVLVEANSNGYSDLLTAVQTAANYTGVSVVSLSWGSDEFSGETSYDSYFKHYGVTFVASTGDAGSPGCYPAYSPYVVAVGGTSLTINSSTYAYVSETAWSSSGGGISSYESELSYQSSVNGTTTYRTIPDVSFVADPSTGVRTYILTQDGSSGSWYIFGGTSVGAPCWAGIFAIINQMRVANGYSVLNAASYTQTHSFLYVLYTDGSGCYHDITSGSNGDYSCTTGYDEVTGVGSPVCNVLITAMTSQSAVPSTAPTGVTLRSTYDTGTSSSDNITQYNNSSSLTALRFTVTGTISGATVTIYADGVVIGTATASSTTTSVLTSGTVTLADGTHTITAKQTELGKAESEATAGLAITIDATLPTVAATSIASGATVTTGTKYYTVTFSEVMDTAILDATDFLLVGASYGTISAASYTWTSTTTLRLEFDNLKSDTYTLTLYKGTTHFRDIAGNTLSTNYTSTFVVDPPPKVTGVYVSGSAWSSTFLSYLSSTGVGSSTYGYAVPTGSTSQLTPLPWSGIDKISIVFNEAVTVVSSDLLVYGVNTSSYTISSFSYNSSTHTATWTLSAAVSADKLRLIAGAAGDITDATGNTLDGEWTDSTSTISGDDLGGGTFQFCVYCLPGDVNQDGRVNVSDKALTVAAVGTTTSSSSGYSIFYDVDGSSRINVSDKAIVVAHVGTTLPSGTPASAAIAVPVEEEVTASVLSETDVAAIVTTEVSSDVVATLASAHGKSQAESHASAIGAALQHLTAVDLRSLVRNQAA